MGSKKKLKDALRAAIVRNLERDDSMEGNDAVNLKTDNSQMLERNLANTEKENQSIKTHF